MKIQYICLSLLFLAGVFYSCEEIEDPAEGLQKQDLFVQYGAGVPDSVTVEEGDLLEDYIAVQAPISFETDLTATLSLTGDGTALADFEVTGEDVVSQTENLLTITIPFIPAGGEDLVTDQTFLSFNFPTDGVADGTKYVTMILEGATGPNGIDLLGGRGPLRKKVVFEIEDID